MVNLDHLQQCARCQRHHALDLTGLAVTVNLECCPHFKDVKLSLTEPKTAQEAAKWDPSAVLVS